MKLFSSRFLNSLSISMAEQKISDTSPVAFLMNVLLTSGIACSASFPQNKLRRTDASILDGLGLEGSILEGLDDWPRLGMSTE